MDCLHDPEQKIAWGCDEPTQVPVWVDEEEDCEYYTCPFKFIPATILEWYSEYSYYKEFNGTAPSYWDQGDKWQDVAVVYNRYYGELLQTIQKQEMSKYNTKGLSHGVR